MTEKVLLTFCLQASGIILTEAGGLENPLLMGSVFDTVSSTLQRKQVTSTAYEQLRELEVEVKRSEDRIRKYMYDQTRRLAEQDQQSGK